MQLFLVNDSGLRQHAEPLETLAAPPETGFVWLAVQRADLPAQLPTVQALAERWGGSGILDLHCNDLLSEQHPPRYDYTSVYDLVIFRALKPLTGAAERSVFQTIETQAISFVVFDRLLISVHPADCNLTQRVLARFAARAINKGLDLGGKEGLNPVRTKAPSDGADLMLRMMDGVVDDYLAIRKDLAAGLEGWLVQLLKPTSRVKDWTGLLTARNQLHALENMFEEHHDAVTEWLSGYVSPKDTPLNPQQRDSVVARARDLTEHIQRLVQHVRRLENAAETGVQIYFGAQSNRTNSIMKTLTALTAVFLPLNLITGFFGMNFDFLPLVHQEKGVWWAIATMTAVALVLVLVFWRKRYLASSGR